MAEHSAPDHKHKPGAASSSSSNSAAGSSQALANSRGSSAAAGGGSPAGGGGLSGGLSQPAGWQSLLSFTILFLAWLAGFSSRLFAVIRFESIIHEFDPW